MTAHAHRLRHPAWLVWLLGGLMGTAINILVTLALMNRWSPPLAFFCGTLANELFHHFYYQVVYVNRELRHGPSLVQLILLHFVIAGAAAGALHALLAWFSPMVALAVALTVLAVVNSAVNRVHMFGSAELAMIEYAEVDQCFYDDQTDAGKVNIFRALFHRRRFAQLAAFVEEHSFPAAVIVDLGCGNCLWNTRGYSVIGVDINEGMLRWARQQGRITEFRLCDDLSATGLSADSVDVAIASEVLEHLLDVDKTVREVVRILRPGGVFLVTVPYDFFLGPFFVLFNLNCLWQGYVRGSKYHRYRCGHVNHFTRTRLRSTLETNGLRVESLRVKNGLTLHAAAVKTAGAPTPAPRPV